MSATLHHRPPASVPPVTAPDDAQFLVAMGRRVREARERRHARKAIARARASQALPRQLEAGEGNASVLLLRNVARALKCL
jgi:XRE family aerobic/anaerobic benzoate catabolism transcriptional regulator